MLSTAKKTGKARPKKSTEVSFVMSGAIPEADWRVFRRLHPIWIDRFCKRVNDELLRVLSDDSRDAHEQYLAAYKLMHKRDKEIASAFDDFRRSPAIFQIAIIRKLGDHRRGTWAVQRVNTRHPTNKWPFADLGATGQGCLHLRATRRQN